MYYSLLKKAILVLLLTPLLCCSNKRVSEKLLTDCDFIIGSWEMTSNGNIFSEVWSRESDSVFVGRGLITSGLDTLFEEQLKISIYNGNICFSAQVQDQNDGRPILFEKTDTTDGIIVFINNDHDYPQKITYKQCVNDSLYACVEGVINSIYRKEVFNYKAHK